MQTARHADSGVSGSTDLVKVGIVSAVLAKGSGIGNGTVSGKVRLAPHPGDSSKIEPGEILVMQDTTAEDSDAICHAAGIVTEAPSETSHAAVIAQRLGIPAISGVTNATRDLRHGEVITLQIRDGLVHRGTGVTATHRLDCALRPMSGRLPAMETVRMAFTTLRRNRLR